uniref:Uncharacterized protein n=1 Tax=Rhizophora mucronata TaxID=61149 RepID=A0A2P2QXT3_RHIMU
MTSGTRRIDFDPIKIFDGRGGGGGGAGVDIGFGVSLSLFTSLSGNCTVGLNLGGGGIGTFSGLSFLAASSCELCSETLTESEGFC